MAITSADFAAVPSSVAPARRLVLDAAAAFGLAELEDRAQLLASELVTNAVRHSRGPVRVRAAHPRTGTLAVTVCDDGGGRPTVQHQTGSGDRGRGLQIVDAMADRWGVAFRRAGKCVWFELVGADDHAERTS
jgi:anti-sigma regulatory factor (Ser/Thr protein kinase)